MYKTLPLIKSHYSLGKSILTLEKPRNKEKESEYPIRILDLLIENKLDTLVLVDDNVSGLLQASKNCQDNKIKLVFGLRISVTDNVEDKKEENLNKKSKYIIFVKNPNGYQNLIKIWTFAATNGFYYEPCIDFKTLKTFWDEKNLSLVVPFYDSFLYLNNFESHIHVPDFSFTEPKFLIENNELPFDNFLKDKVTKFSSENKFDFLNAQSIFYKSSKDFIAYLAFKCIHNRTTVEKPNLDHMASDEFNFDKWLKENK